ncbi:MGMT family protein [Candidatus Woesearchaeota archaeon]|nr:MAG: MGMT family protein [Candidatus Woesearchaeota archaeon]
MTEFQTKVLLKTAEIPKGKVSTYSDIAEAIGTNAVRAVGTVLRKNPCPPEIPCHRVVKSDGTLGMYSGEKTKKEMLEQEGIKISDDGKVTRFQEKRHRF